MNATEYWNTMKNDSIPLGYVLGEIIPEGKFLTNTEIDLVVNCVKIGGNLRRYFNFNIDILALVHSKVNYLYILKERKSNKNCKFYDLRFIPFPAMCYY